MTHNEKQLLTAHNPMSFPVQFTCGKNKDSGGLALAESSRDKQGDSARIQTQQRRVEQMLRTLSAVPPTPKSQEGKTMGPCVAVDRQAK